MKIKIINEIAIIKKTIDNSRFWIFETQKKKQLGIFHFEWKKSKDNNINILRQSNSNMQLLLNVKCHYSMNVKKIMINITKKCSIIRNDVIFLTYICVIYDASKFIANLSNTNSIKS